MQLPNRSERETVSLRPEPRDVPILAARLRDSADVIVAMQAEIDRLEAVIAENQRVVRLIYRRGYWAGRCAARRGAVAVTNPESAARGETRRMLAGAA